MLIEDVYLMNSEKQKRNIYKTKERLFINIKFTSQDAENIKYIPVAVIFTKDGIVISQFIGKPHQHRMTPNKSNIIILEIPELQLGNGEYLLSVALYKSIDYMGIKKPELYDLIDRSIEFKVIGNPPLITELCHQEGDWKTFDEIYF